MIATNYRLKVTLCLVGLFAICLFMAKAEAAITQNEAVAWVRSQEKRAGNCDVDGNGLWCTDLVTAYMNYCWLQTNNDGREPWSIYKDVYTTATAHDYDNMISGNVNWMVITRDSSTVPQPGDIFVSENDAVGLGYGHVGIVLTPYGSTSAEIMEMNPDTKPHTNTVVWGCNKTYNAEHFIRFLFFKHEPDPTPIPTGHFMETGYNRVLPDGDYIIASASDPNYYLDISGGAYPANNGDNVNLYHTTDISNISDHDAWTIKYENGFYRISQYGQNVSLDVTDGNAQIGTNIQALTSTNNNTAQQWAISTNGNKGYRLQARCSSYSLDICGGILESGRNIQQWEGNDTDAQRWVFIPYKPKNTLPAGRYIVISAENDNVELDITGDTYDIENGCNVQVWYDDSDDFYENSKSRYNAFDVTYYGGGYYQLAQAISGKVIDVDSWVTTNSANLQMWDNTHCVAQLWAITETESGSGKYFLRPKCSGLVMDLARNVGESIVNGHNVHQHFYHGGNNQLWKFVKAEHTVTYDANGGTFAPSPQIKYYKGKLLLSEGEPMREGYTFKGWGTSSSATDAVYQPGDEYKPDADITLYAIWERISYSITYDANGGQNPPAKQTKLANEDINLSNDAPTRSGYSFLGWATDSNSTEVAYHAGDACTVDDNLILYAVWERLRYSITYDANGGSNAPQNQTKISNESIKLSEDIPVLPGSTFLGWATSPLADNPEYYSGETYSTDANLMLYAVWESNQYVILYIANGAQNMPTRQAKLYNEDITLSNITPTLSGCTFIGWATDPTATIPEYKPGDIYSANASIALYPIWVRQFYTISYNSNEGENLPANQTKLPEESISLSDDIPIRSGYDFMGWATSSTSSLVAYQPGDPYATDADLILYAVWKRQIFSITYDANGGKNPPAKQTKYSNASIFLSKTVPIFTGYTFLGWATDPTATMPEYQPGDSYSTDSDLLLYAVWQITNPPTLTGNDVILITGDTRNWQDCVLLSHDGILSYTLSASISGSAVELNGTQIIAKSPGFTTITVSVVEYPAATCTFTAHVVAPNSILHLPSALTTIDDEAFENSGASAVIIPDSCETIGSKAFAGNHGLVYVYIPESVTSIDNTAFLDCPDVTVYCYANSTAHQYAENNSLHCVILNRGWVSVSNLPLGASVVDEKWTYNHTTIETTTSTESSMDGWEQTGFSWQFIRSGIHVYANYPYGFSQSHSLYSKYDRSQLPTTTVSGNTMRVASSSDRQSFIYWHWTTNGSDGTINNAPGVKLNRDYSKFCAFESTTVYPRLDNGIYWAPEFGCRYSSYWYRIDVMRQNYTDY